MRYILFSLLIISVNGYSQCKTYMIGVNGDTLNCVDMNGLKQGPWVNQKPPLRGEPGYEEQGYYVNDKKEGRWQQFTLQGDLIAIENYRWGNKHGQCFYYTRFGQPLREENWKAVNPDDPYDTVDVYDLHDPTKITGRAVVKLDGFTLKHGTWKFYDPEYGTIVKTERFRLDKPVSEFGDELAPIDIRKNGLTGESTDSTGKKTVAKPQAVLEYEKKNSGKKKIKVRDGRTGYN